ncbi:MAG: 30S ribosomal protein S4 [Patescibacteria group bacterium]|nr:30S ribosomal protein S4 [Patescibacteria group bacterium]
MKKVKKYKIGRRLGAGVFEKCQTQKFVLSEARHAKNKRRRRRRNVSAYGSQLIEKQKVRVMYGINERQFRNYVNEAVSQKTNPAAEYLLELLERRLDNVVYRLGLAGTRRLARQMVSHGHIVVNGKKITVPSHRVALNDEISVREGSKKSILFVDMVKKLKNYNCPNWLKFNPETLVGVVQGKPDNTEGFIDLPTVLEFYSR